MNWITNSGMSAIVGAVLGSIITGIISLFIWWKSRNLKKVTCIVNRPRSLLSISKTIEKKLKVFYGDKQVSSAFLFPLEINNKGNTAVKKQPVHIVFSQEAKIADYNIKTNPEIGFKDIELVCNKDNKLKFIIELLNPGDSVSVDILCIDNSDDSIKVGLKNENVKTELVFVKNIEETLDKLSENTSLFGTHRIIERILKQFLNF